LLALADDVLGIEDDRREAIAEEGGEPRLALDVGERRQILAIDVQRVEQEQGEAPPTGADRLLERGEVGGAALVQLYDLAVEQRRLALQLRSLGGDLRELVGPVEPRAREDAGLAARDEI
jgi:hypothetical protein